VNKENLKKIGYAPDSTGYYPLFTGLEHCLLMGKLYGYTSQANAKEADEVLRKV
jgi:ABC-type multidrug transport system ATPase subunit